MMTGSEMRSLFLRKVWWFTPRDPFRTRSSRAKVVFVHKPRRIVPMQ